MIKRYPTLGVLNKRQAEALQAKLLYSVENISACSLEPETQEIVIGLTSDTDLAVVNETVNKLIDKEKTNRIIGHRTVWTTEEQDQNDGEHGRGDHRIESVFSVDGTVRSGLAVVLAQRLDALLVDLALRHRAELRSYSSKISLDTLNKCGYIASFPQNLYLVAEFPHALQTLEQVRHAERLDELVRLSPFTLSPAVCFHCYAELSGLRLKGPLALTASGLCHRHEAPWRLGNHRLNEFTMREIVLFGDSAHIEAQRSAIMEEVWNLFQSLGLSGKIENASDPFYFSEDSAKGQHQIMGNMKYELIADLGEPRGSFSIASFNHMGDSLCKPFQVHDTDDAPLNSGCVAFGIDRWVYALLSSYGPSSTEWPAEVRKALHLD
ncbi:amino acid--ACP ligase [Paenibacillus sp. M1]|uniref:Amino acid--ACP ligase n=1 Tax=Paenibacillus haidiansis TaxID=1574488 RepID=A0ABU7VRW3_9BACL